MKETIPFTPHIIYTFSGFANLPQRDNDQNLWANGVWGPCDDEGSLFEQANGFEQEGHAFYLSSFGVLVDIAKIDGVVEMAWRGKQE